MEKEILTLGIESSCDETSAAVLRGGRTVLSNVISTQIPIHQKFGGVVPEIASRKHIVNIMPVIDEAVRQAGVTLTDIDQVAVTYGPGLVGALLVGVSAAKALAFALDKPLIGVNHLEGHIFANFLADPTLEPPFMALVVSGGHTALVDVRGYDTFHMMGQTRDDAAGEAFDKIARVMGLPYPGGPRIVGAARQNFPIQRQQRPLALAHFRREMLATVFHVREQQMLFKDVPLIRKFQNVPQPLRGQPVRQVHLRLQRQHARAFPLRLQSSCFLHNRLQRPKSRRVDLSP